nr:unnamed protein product [Callosobruchus analis]
MQSGFHIMHGTQFALLKVSDHIASSLDQSMRTALILLDQSKAFDIVNHELLLAKLHYIGLNAEALKLMKSYITNRAQRVVLDRKFQCPSIQNASAGVPQGSVSGPVVFSIFIFDLPETLTSRKVHLCADDIQIYMPPDFSNLYEGLTSVHTDLNNTYKYCDKHGLRINSSKTLSLCIGSTSQSRVMRNSGQLSMNNENINWVDYAKNFGVYFDNAFTVSHHVDNICGKSFFKLKSLYHFKKTLKKNKTAFSTVFNIFTRGVLSLCPL